MCYIQQWREFTLLLLIFAAQKLTQMAFHSKVQIDVSIMELFQRKILWHCLSKYRFILLINQTKFNVTFLSR